MELNLVRVTRVTGPQHSILGAFARWGFARLDVSVLWAVYKRTIQFLASDMRTLWSFLLYRIEGDSWPMITKLTALWGLSPGQETAGSSSPPSIWGIRHVNLIQYLLNTDTRFPLSIITISRKGNS